MNNKAKFETFLESLKGNGQDSLIESVKQGFKVCFEGCNALFESVSSIVYHVTHVSNLEKILKDNQFILSSSLSNEADMRQAHKKFFYLSVSRIKYGGYALHKDSLDANIVLDGDKLNQNYEGISVDYWGHRDNRDESEDRILSTKQIIKPASKYIKEIHIIFQE